LQEFETALYETQRRLGAAEWHALVVPDSAKVILRIADLFVTLADIKVVPSLHREAGFDLGPTEIADNIPIPVFVIV
jgi:hypothetical protein